MAPVFFPFAKKSSVINSFGLKSATIKIWVLCAPNSRIAHFTSIGKKFLPKQYYYLYIKGIFPWYLKSGYQCKLQPARIFKLNFNSKVYSSKQFDCTNHEKMSLQIQMLAGYRLNSYPRSQNKLPLIKRPKICGAFLCTLRKTES